MCDVDSEPLNQLATRAMQLDVVAPDEARHLVRDECALLADELAVRVARGTGALDVRKGQLLEALSIGDRVLRLGPACIQDYARERLGLSAEWTRSLRLLGRELKTRPLLARAVAEGTVSACAALAVLKVARGLAEPVWVERAQTWTVRQLEEAARIPLAVDDEEWDRIWVQLTEEQRAIIDAALEVARRVVRPNAARWELLQAILQEFLALYPAEVIEHDEPAVFSSRLEDSVAKETMEVLSERWSVLGKVEPAAAPVGDALSDPFDIDRELLELVARGHKWHAALGRLGLIIRHHGLWRDLQFASFGHYCQERLGLGVRTVEQHVSLERRLHFLPLLQKAYYAGTVPFEKARLLSRVATEQTEEEWLQKAESMTAIALKRLVDSTEDAQAQMSGGPGLLASVPRGVTTLLTEVCLAVRAIKGPRTWQGECLSIAAAHFISVWEPYLRQKKGRGDAIRERDGRLCQFPGCSLAGTDLHHIEFRSHGGSNDPSNQTNLCEPHHLIGIHRGYARVSGRAPDELLWEMGLRPGQQPLITVLPTRAG